MKTHTEYMRQYMIDKPEKKARSDQRWMKHSSSHKQKLRDYTSLIKSRPCVDCDVEFGPWVMHFDHRDPSIKVSSVSQMVADGKPFESVRAEIAKCDVVCANCHAERTHRQRINKEI